ncbi:MAG: hypothetical protein GX442_18320 [Candidatus Riflebacteria bacterium]|nr:hypothetical protein [Candidatus Riflebacteria bacterium]
MDDIGGWAGFLVWTVVKIVLVTVGLVIIMTMVDPFYFDQPLAVAEAGLEAGQAPPPPFATSVVIPVELGDPLKVALGARDASTRARVEVLQPSGFAAYDRQLEIRKPTTMASRQGWQAFSVGVPETGTYTIRVTQDNPGMIKIYLFQGPFLARMLFLPVFAAFLVLIISFLRRGRGRGETTKTLAPAAGNPPPQAL